MHELLLDTLSFVQAVMYYGAPPEVMQRMRRLETYIIGRITR